MSKRSWAASPASRTRATSTWHRRLRFQWRPLSSQPRPEWTRWRSRIGTAHGAAKFAGEPRLDFERLEAICNLIQIPLVLHGASAVDADGVSLAQRFGAHLPLAGGIPEEFVRSAIKLGVAKINTDSDLRLAALGHLRQVLAEQPDLFNMYALMGEIESAIEAVTLARIELLGSSGRAR